MHMYQLLNLNLMELRLPISFMIDLITSRDIVFIDGYVVCKISFEYSSRQFKLVGYQPVKELRSQVCP